MDEDFGKALAVAKKFANALLRLIFENQNLGVAILAQDRAGDFGTCDSGCTYDDSAVVTQQHNVVERNRALDLGIDGIATDDVTCGNAVLLAVGLNDGIVFVIES